MPICKLFLRVTAVSCVLFLCLAGPVLAQNATLTGTVTDAETGEALPGANVSVTSGTAQTGAATGNSGVFEVRRIRPGTYTIKISYIGYEAYTVADVVLSAGESKTLNAALKLTGIELNPIAVTASRRPEKTMEAPASISVLDAREIATQVATSSSSLLQNVTGVDMSSTGVDRKEVVLRGFNNAFSGAAYILTDFRQAAAPSLGVNIHSIMPNMSIDLEKVEIVRGPGSALYGAGVDAGVIHYITKDPFNYPGTTIAFAGGERSTLSGQFRHAGAFGNVGYKLTGQYAQADDFKLDPKDALDNEQLQLDLQDSTGAVNPRNNDYKKMNVNGLLQYRFNDKVTLTAAGGFSQLDATVLSGIGTLQADNFGYTYGQVRLQADRFFAQAYINRNDGGDSFVYGTGVKVVDHSTLINLQAQYDLEFLEGKEQLIVGVDYDRTNADTDETIYGRNEKDALISETGVYAQSLTNISKNFDLTVGIRGDFNNVIDELQFSPRVALVFKPSVQQSLRLTYNRAFSSPGNNSMFLDIDARTTNLSPVHKLILVGLGSRNGFTFNNFRNTQKVKFFIPVPGLFGADIPLSQYPVAPVYGATAVGFAKLLAEGNIPAALSSFSSDQLKAIAGLLGFVAQKVVSTRTVQAILGIPDSGEQLGYRQVNAPTDIKPLKQTITQGFEAGYKGLIGSRVLFAADAYFTKKKNFVGPLQVESPFAYINPQDIGADAGALIGAALLAGDPTVTALVSSLGGPDQLPTSIIPLLAGIIGQTASGVVQSDQTVLREDDPNAVGGFLAYRNFGNVDFWGFDVSLQVLATDRLSFFGNVSVVSDDFFDNKELDESGTDLSLALNAPTFKTKFGFNYNKPFGFSVNGAARYVKGFPVLSGDYVGDVENYFLVDVGAGYDLGRMASGMRFDISVQNILDNDHREFIGAPKIGRVALARLSYTIR